MINRIFEIEFFIKSYSFYPFDPTKHQASEMYYEIPEIHHLHRVPNTLSPFLEISFIFLTPLIYGNSF